MMNVYMFADYIMTAYTGIYLLVQAVRDNIDRQVYVLLNDISLFIAAIYSFYTYKGGDIVTYVLPLILIMVFCMMGLYGTGDMKALMVIYLTTDYVTLLMVILVANVLFLAMNRKIKGRAAYFPALFIGYLSIVPLRYL